MEIFNSLTIEDIYSILNQFSFNENTGFGFSEFSLEGEYLEATLIKRTPIFIADFVDNQIAKKQIFIYSEIPFALDSFNSLLEIYDATKHVAKVMQALKKALNNQVSFTGCDLFPSLIIPKLSKQRLSVNIDKLVINNFKYEGDVIGRYNCNVLNTNIGMQLLNEYGKDVTKAVVKVDNNDEVYFLEFHSAGRITIRSEEALFKDILSFFKTLLKSKRNA